MDDNRLTGTLPCVLGELTSLTHMYGKSESKPLPSTCALSLMPRAALGSHVCNRDEDCVLQCLTSGYLLADLGI